MRISRLSRLRVRTLLALIAAPTVLMVAIFGASSWVQLRDFEQEAETIHAEAVVISEMASLRFDLTNSVFSRQTQVRLPALYDAASSQTFVNAWSRFDDSFAVLRQRRDTLERLGGHEAVELVELLVSNGELWDPALPDAPDPNDPEATARWNEDVASVDAAMLSTVEDFDRIISRMRDRVNSATALTADPIIDIIGLQTMLTDEATLVLSVIVNPSGSAGTPGPVIVSELQRTGAVQSIVLDRLRERIEPTLYQQLVDALHLETNVALRGQLTTYAETRDVTPLLDFVADNVTALTSRYWEIGEVRDSVIDELVSSAADELGAAETRYRNVAGTMLLLALVGVVLAVGTARGLSTRLSALAFHAESVSNGKVPKEPLRLVGPVELASVGEAFDGMTAQLEVLDRQIVAIAEGALDEPILRAELPGPLGEDLKRSVSRVVSTTAQLVAAEALTSTIVESAADAIFSIDANGVILAANVASSELTSLSRSAVLGRRVDDLLDGLPQPRAASRRGGSEELVLERFDGRRFNVLATVRALGTEADAGFTLYVRDISDRVRWEERFRRLATTDQVTGLPNSLGLSQHLELAPDMPAHVIAIELDRFRAVANTVGAVAADRIRGIAASRLLELLPERSFVARVGDAEFVAIIDTERPAACVGADMREALAEPVAVGGGSEVRLGMVAGFAEWEESDGRPPLHLADIVRRSQLALMKAKDTGVSLREFESSLEAEADTEVRLEQRLRVAIETNALELHAQPIVSLADERICGFEMLARWRDEGRWIGPDVFIPIAERAGLISALERWAMSEAVQFLDRLHRAGFNLSVSVNLSGLHLLSGTVVDELTALLSGVEWDPTLLHIEVTESVLVDDDHAIDELSAVRDMGPRIWLDDFGTGYSSLTYLNRLPVDGIKLDRSFVTASTTETSKELIRIVADIAKTFDLAMVAEGIEEELQRDLLRSMGYEQAQGWLWHRARPVDELWSLLEKNRRTAGHDDSQPRQQSRCAGSAPVEDTTVTGREESGTVAG